MAWFEPGAMVVGCEVVRLIGAGGHAEVYEVRDPSGVVRALKVIKVTDQERGKKLAERLLQEGRILGSMDHPNLVRLYDAGIEGDLVWLLLERVAGCNLTEALRAQREVPRLEAAVRWIKLACEGVAAAHKRGIVHRDLKPENILVAPNDVVKVIDFGVAKIDDFGVKTTREHELGTVLYMSKQQMTEKHADVRMDVYSMGLTLYEALAGAHPYTGPRTVAAIVAWHLDERPRPLREVVPEAPADLEALVAKAIDKDPERRFADARAMADALDEVLSRMLAPKRRLARNLPASLDRPLAHDVTVPMPAVGEAGAPPLPPAAVLRGVGATVPMQAASFAAVAPPTGTPPVGWAPPRNSPVPATHAPPPAPPPPVAPLPRRRPCLRRLRRDRSRRVCRWRRLRAGDRSTRPTRRSRSPFLLRAGAAGVWRRWWCWGCSGCWQRRDGRSTRSWSPTRRRSRAGVPPPLPRPRGAPLPADCLPEAPAMPDAPDAPDDPVLEAELDRAIEPYRALLPPDLLAELRASLGDALTTHPVGRALLDRARPAPVVQRSGTREKDAPGAQADEPPKKKGMGNAS